MVSYDGKRFRPAEATEPVVVTYRQDGDLMWAEVPAGNGIRRGSLAGTCAPDGTLDFAYSFVLDDNQVVSGRCHSIPTQLNTMGMKVNLADASLDTTTVAIGPRANFSIGRGMFLRPGISYSRALDQPLSGQSYNMLQVDVPVLF